MGAVRVLQPYINDEVRLLAVAVIPNHIFSTYIFLAIILLQVTPTAKRNSYRVAILVGALPRVAGIARYPGLCNRNSVRVAWGAYQPTGAPSHAFPKGKEPHQTPLNTASRGSSPLGRVGEGLPMAINLLPLGEGWDGATIWLFYRQRRLFDFAPCQPAGGQVRRWVVADIREPALGNICNRTQTHRAKP